LTRHDGGNRSGAHGGGGSGREPPAREDPYAKRSRPDESPSATATTEPLKVETAAEKLARLKAKRAAQSGGSFTARIGGDYAGGVSSAPAKGLQRYQQLVREERK